MSQLQGKPAPRAVPGLGPHGIALLLAAAVIFSPGLIARSTGVSTDADGRTAECALLKGFLESPELLASFRGTSEELQRWVDTYDRDCN